MIFDFPKLVTDRKLDIKGIVQIGANDGQEVELFKEFNAIYIEPLPIAFEILRTRTSHAYQELITNTKKTIKFHQASLNMCSSVYNTDASRGQGVEFLLSHELEGLSLEDFFAKYTIDPSQFNTLVSDTEGSELDILRGATLQHVDYIIIEYNVAYENTKEALETYLTNRGYNLVDSITCDPLDRYGDLLFVKA